MKSNHNNGKRKTSARIYVPIIANVANDFGDRNLFAQQVRERHPQKPVLILFQKTRKPKPFKAVVSRAFRGGTVSAHEANVMCRQLGVPRAYLFEVTQS